MASSDTNNKASSNNQGKSPLKVDLTTSVDTLVDGGRSTLTFTFSGAPIGFDLNDIKVTNGVVTNLIQSKTNPFVYTADFTGAVNSTSSMSTIKLDGLYTDTMGKAGTPSNTVTIKNNAPSLVGLAFDSVVDVTNGPKAMTIAATATDSSGIRQINVWYDKPLSTNVGSFNLAIIGLGSDNFKDKTPDYATTSSMVQKYATPGDYTIAHVDVTDNAGNTHVYSTADLAAAGIKTGFKIVGAAADTTAPVLKGLAFDSVIDVSKGNVKETFGVTATDNVGVKQVNIWLDKGLTTDSGPSKLMILGLNTDNFTDSTPNYASQTLNVKSVTEPGVYKITSVDITDLAGNKVTYQNTDLVNMGIKNSFTVVGQGGADTTPPELKGLSMTPVIDVSSGPKAYTLSVTATDAVGVKQVNVWTDKPLSTDTLTCNLMIAGLGTDNFKDNTPTVATTSALVQKYTMPGTYTITHVDVTDNAGNVRIYSTADLKSLGISTIFEVKGATGDTTLPILVGTGKSDAIIGTANKDVIGGTAHGELIDGMGGNDIITGYAGADIFVFAKSYAAKTVDLAATIMDFSKGDDLIGLRGLAFSDIKLAAGTGTHASDTILSLSTGDVLAVLVGVNPANLSAEHFNHVP